MSAQSSDKIGPPWTTLKMLTWMTGYFEKQKLANPRLDAEMLLSHALGLQRIMIYAQFDRPLSNTELDTIRGLVKRRAQHEPIAYITGSRGFWTIDLKTDARALIPRPDTETLVEAAIARMPEDAARARVLDIGTGSGAIALAIANDCPEAQVAAVDISAEALALARENAAALSLNQVTFFESDLLESLPAEWRSGLDLVVSNPPYISHDEEHLMGEDVKRHEPKLALFADEDGLAVIKRLIPQAHAALAPERGWLLCEIGFAQGAAVSALFTAQGFTEVEVIKDLASKDRVVVGRRA